MTTKNPRRARLMRDFGRRLRAARLTAGWEQAVDFGAQIGCEKARYGRYERGEVTPPLDVLEDIVGHLGVTLDWLLLGKKRPAVTE